jgi:hypothetical protein
LHRDSQRKNKIHGEKSGQKIFFNLPVNLLIFSLFWPRTALGIGAEILFSGFSPIKRLQRKARPASSMSLS